MLEFLRSIRLGGLSIFGVTLPGMLLLGFVSLGFVFPTIFIATSITGGSLSGIVNFTERNLLLAGLVFLLLGYTLGYILRLFSPDKLDSKSGDIVRQQMPEHEQKVWPYTGCPGDKFPYFCTRQYLEARGLSDTVELVTWGADKECPFEPPCNFHQQDNQDKQYGKRSKTVVNKIKIQLALTNADIAAIAESNEAHIRLMFGAWLAVRWAWPLVVFGAFASGLFLLLGCCGTLRGGIGIPESAISATGMVWCSNIFCLEVILLFCMLWIARQIKSVFHYRRVGELVYILQAWAICKKTQVDRASA